MRDDETLFRYGVTLNQITMWQVSANSFEELPAERYGVFYSGEGKFVFVLFSRSFQERMLPKCYPNLHDCLIHNSWIYYSRIFLNL